jgi:2-amino-4-hydroxy-6-hydroxymethyldihydropteridine diphosphokinase
MMPASRRAYVGLGANLDDPAARVAEALQRLGQLTGMTVAAASPLYRSAPLGQPGQPDYCNAACVLDTVLTPEGVLDALLAQERAMGRVRAPNRRWGPRRIDLDLLWHEAGPVAGPRLRLPHPELHRRNFVLVPLADVAPELMLPGLGRVQGLAAALGREGLEPWTDEG